jgi:hypothetical protein
VNASDQVDANGNAFDASGFAVNNARIMAEGGSGGFGAYIEYQFASTDTNDTGGFDLVTDPLLDAYVTQDLGGMMLTIGRHKVVGNASSMEHERDMFFQTRSNIGYHYVNRDEGVSISGEGNVNWSVGISDGFDGTADEYRINAHAGMDFGGGFSAGISYTQDGFQDGDAIIVDLAYASDAFNVGLEFLSMNDGGAFTAASDLATFFKTDGSAVAQPTALFLDPDAAPFAVNATIPLGGESHIGVRFQDSDIDAFGETIDVAYKMGNWTAQYTTVDGDAIDSDFIIVGLQVGF